jgi:hypothetical protein
VPDYTISYARPDVVAYFSQLPVPENNGYAVGLYDWFALPDGPHWIHVGVTDAQRGAGEWAIVTTLCFVKWGGNSWTC